MSCVTVNVPKAPEPLACILLSGITSLSKCANFSRNQKSSKSIGPLFPTVLTFWFSAIGLPETEVSFFFLSSIIKFIFQFFIIHLQYKHFIENYIDFRR